MKKREITRRISAKELQNESENKFKFFRIKYTQWDEIVPRTREYMEKKNVERIIDSPATMDYHLWVIEVVDDG